MLTTLAVAALLALTATPDDARTSTPALPPDPVPEHIAPPSFPEHVVPVSVDSGDRQAEPGAGDMQRVYSAQVGADGAPYIRVAFGELHLPGAEGSSQRSYLTITSLRNGAVQYLDARAARQWAGMSAYFNGDRVRVELFASPETGPARVEVIGVVAGEWRTQPRSLCGGVDDRQLSSDARIGRIMPVACTAWLFNDRSNCLLTAGHCGPANNQVVQFNVPLSDSAGNPVAPPPEDQYPVDPISVQTTGNAGVGGDWSTFGVFNNSNTGLSPLAAQGASFQLAASAPAVAGQSISITGFGSTAEPVPAPWDSAQKTHSGPYLSVSGTTVKYAADTTGGNSGSPVIDESTGMAIGIHTHAGCNTNGNQGTAIHLPALQDALNHPQGVCVPLSLTFSYPFGRPGAISPDGEDTLRVVIGADAGVELAPFTVRLHVDDGSGEQIVAMTEVSDATYEGVFPPVACGGPVDYFVTAQDTEGTVYFDPRAAPGDPYTTLVGHSIVFAANYDFETEAESDWIIDNHISLLTGAWEIGIPLVGAQGAPQADYDLSGRCWLTGNTINEDVDGGPSRLSSPVLDLSAMTSPTFSYARWITNNSGDTDALVVEVSDDAGASWTLVESVTATDDTWVKHSVSLDDYIEINDRFAARFSISDNPNNSVLEGAIDQFQVFEAACFVSCTAADIAQPLGVIDITDVLAFLVAFTEGDPIADLAPPFGVYEASDIIAFLTSFAFGCP